VPIGAAGLWIGPHSYVGIATELLLPRNTRYRITSFHLDPATGIVVLDAEVLLPGAVD